jgi:hypothetical protein
MGQLLLKFVERLIDSRYLGGGQWAIRSSFSFDDNQINRKACALLAVEVAGNRQMLRDPIVLIEEVVEGATFASVIALRAEFFLLASLPAENQHSSPLGLHD